MVHLNVSLDLPPGLPEGQSHWAHWESGFARETQARLAHYLAWLAARQASAEGSAEPGPAESHVAESTSPSEFLQE